MNNILQFNNRAGLVGESTFEPLRQLTHIIETANRHKQPLWIGIQDLSKAYDHCNISLLHFALRCINLPWNIIYIIINLFSNRTNQICLSTSLSEPYDILQGIDQGEVISPLIWILYYESMFARINQTEEVLYNTTVMKFINIHQPEKDVPITYKCSVLGYLDDTTWIARNQPHMEQLLWLSNSCYKMVNIKINYSKYKLLCNDKSMCNKTIDLHFTPEESTPIKILGKNKTNVSWEFISTHLAHNTLLLLN